MTPPRREVVGAAIVRAGRVLAARRTAPPEAAQRPGQRWEFPGGKVEAGESAADAVVREVREELGCGISVTGWLEGYADIGAAHRLTVAAAVLSEGEPIPRAGEHDAVWWLGPDDLDAVDWLGPDRPFLGRVAALLREGGRPVRGIFFDREHAESARRRLVGDGFSAQVLPERYAGEDDDEDHAWAVLTDAPWVALELLVDAYDGWLDDGVADAAPTAPLDLPSAPRRQHRPGESSG